LLQYKIMSFPAELQPLIRENELLAGHTWLRIGGTAKYFATPTSVDQLVGLVTHCDQQNIPVRVLGGGSNILVRESGVDGCVIDLSAPSFSNIKLDQAQLTCGGGARLAHAITHAVGAGLGGIEHLVGVPGTIGGAVHGNSTTHDGDIGGAIESARVLSRTGEVSVRQREQLQFSTHKSSLDELVILEVEFSLTPADVRQLTQRMQKLWILRRADQPPIQTASIIPFKDPDLSSAAELIDQSGLRGAGEGLVQLSSQHPNFLIANEGATSDQVLALIERVRDTVLTKTGTQLQMHLAIW
jgi:UDP-N-acetylmuramate dehydrogenase